MVLQHKFFRNLKVLRKIYGAQNIYILDFIFNCLSSLCFEGLFHDLSWFGASSPQNAFLFLVNERLGISLNATDLIIYLCKVQLDDVLKDLVKQSIKYTSDFWIIYATALKKKWKNHYPLINGKWKGVLLPQIGPDISSLGTSKWCLADSKTVVLPINITWVVFKKKKSLGYTTSRDFYLIGLEWGPDITIRAF